MSRIGKAPIQIPKGVKAALEAGTLKVEGPLGKLEQRLHPTVGIEIDQAGGLLTVKRADDTRVSRSVHGLTRALAANMVRQFLMYGTGCGIHYSDRREIDRIVAEARASNYGIRSLIDAIVQSELFLTK
jgi:large subunit ribosomal protein L6